VSACKVPKMYVSYYFLYFTKLVIVSMPRDWGCIVRSATKCNSLVVQAEKQSSDLSKWVRGYI
jgi:hypothetical protein